MIEHVRRAACPIRRQEPAIIERERVRQIVPVASLDTVVSRSVVAWCARRDRSVRHGGQSIVGVVAVDGRQEAPPASSRLVRQAAGTALRKRRRDRASEPSDRRARARRNA
jgi:methylmalonyl-CoA mutase N-terminal domain/subunit